MATDTVAARLKLARNPRRSPRCRSVCSSRRSDFGSLVEDHRLRDSAEPNLIVRVAPDDAWLFEHGHHAPMVVCMVDMVDDRDDRSASEALRARA